MIKSIVWGLTKDYLFGRPINLSEVAPEFLNEVVSELIKIQVINGASNFIKEKITCEIAGYEHVTDHCGLDGVCAVKGAGEVKSEQRTKNKSSKFSGTCTFNDVTWNLIYKLDAQKTEMIVSGFYIDGTIAYVIKFPYQGSLIESGIIEKLSKKYPDKTEKYQNISTISFSHTSFPEKFDVLYFNYDDSRENDFSRNFLRKIISNL